MTKEWPATARKEKLEAQIEEKKLAATAGKEKIPARRKMEKSDRLKSVSQKQNKVLHFKQRFGEIPQKLFHFLFVFAEFEKSGLNLVLEYEKKGGGVYAERCH